MTTCRVCGRMLGQDEYFVCSGSECRKIAERARASLKGERCCFPTVSEQELEQGTSHASLLREVLERIARIEQAMVDLHSLVICDHEWKQVDERTIWCPHCNGGARTVSPKGGLET